MKQFEKRLLSLFMVLVMLFSAVPFTCITVSAETVTVDNFDVDGIELTAVDDTGAVTYEASENSFVLSHEGKLLYGVPLISDCAKGNNPGVATPGYLNMYIDTDSTYDRILSFDYVPDITSGKETEGYAIAKVSYTVNDGEEQVITDWGHFEYVVAKNTEANIKFYVINTTGKSSLTVSNVLLARKGGTVSVINHEGGTAEAVDNGNGTWTVRAKTVSPGNQLLAFMTNGNILSNTDNFTFYPSGRVYVDAYFGEESLDNTATYRVGKSVGYYYTNDLQTAINYTAYYPDKTVIVNADDPDDPYDTFIFEEITIPKGVTLVIPEADDGDGDPDTYKLYKNDPHTSETADAPSGPFRTLTVGYGASLTVEGSLYVGGTLYSSGTKPHCMNNGFGQLILEDGSSINMKNGSMLYAWGFVTGNGDIYTEYGSTIYEMLQICDWGGGSKTLNNIMASIFPFSMFYVQNIESRIHFVPGAIEKVFGLGNVYGMALPVNLPFIGEEGSLFCINEGTLLKYVDIDYYEEGGHDYELHLDIIEGDVSVESFPLMSIFEADESMIPETEEGEEDPAFGGMDLELMSSMNSNILAIPLSGMCIDVGEGSRLTTNQPIDILPGSQLYVDEGATFEMNASMRVFDTDAWCENNVITSSLSKADRKLYEENGWTNIVPLQYSPTYNDAEIHNDDTLDDDVALVDINGSVVVNNCFEVTTSGLAAASEALKQLHLLRDNIGFFRTYVPEEPALPDEPVITGRDMLQQTIDDASDMIDYYLGLSSIEDDDEYFDTVEALLDTVIDALNKYLDGQPITDDQYMYIALLFGASSMLAPIGLTTTDVPDNASAANSSIVSSNGTGTIILNNLQNEDVMMANMSAGDSPKSVQLSSAYLKIGENYYQTSARTIGEDTEPIGYGIDSNTGLPVQLAVHTITWLDYDNTVLREDMVVEGVFPNYGSTPTQDPDGNTIYSFSGWSPEVSSANNDAVYTATYAELDWRGAFSLILEGDILLKIYFKLPVADNINDYKAVMESDDDLTPEADNTYEITLEDDTNGYYNLYSVVYPVKAAEMTYDIDLKLYKFGHNGPYLADTYKAAEYSRQFYSTPQPGVPYLIGKVNGKTDWDHANILYKFSQNPENSSEYMLMGARLKAGDSFKVVVYNEDQGLYWWYPDGTNNEYNYIDTDGYYNIYFRESPNYNAGWFYDHFYVAVSDEDTYESGFLPSIDLPMLVKATMNYGAKAQLYFGRLTDEPLADDETTYFVPKGYLPGATTDTGAFPAVTEDMIDDLLGSDIFPVDRSVFSDYGLYYLGSSLVLNDNTKIKHYFRVVDSSLFTNWSGEFKLDGEPIAPQQANQAIVFEIDNIAATDLDTRYVLSCEARSMEYSALDYVKRSLNDNNALSDLCESLYWYNIYADAYFI